MKIVKKIILLTVFLFLSINLSFANDEIDLAIQRYENKCESEKGLDYISHNACYSNLCNGAKQAIDLFNSDNSNTAKKQNVIQTVNNIYYTKCYLGGNIGIDKGPFVNANNILKSAISQYDEKCETTVKKLLRKTNSCYDDLCKSAKNAINYAKTDIYKNENIFESSNDTYWTYSLQYVNIAKQKADAINYDICRTSGSSGGGGLTRGTIGGDSTEGGNSAEGGDSANKGPAPLVNCVGLPGCVDKDKANPTKPDIKKNLGMEVVTNIIGQAIQFVAVIAVIALIISGFLYLISGGEEEKVKKAKTWIIWSLAGVFLSISAWGIIGIINKFTIG